MKTQIQDLDVTIIGDTIVADFFLVEGEVETHNYLQLQKSLIIEHIISSELNMYEMLNAEACDIEQGYHNPESMLMDDPTYCVKSFLEETYSC